MTDQAELLRRAEQVLPGGILGSHRSGPGLEFVVKEGRGAYLWDLFHDKWWGEDVLEERVYGEPPDVYELLRRRRAPTACYAIGGSNDGTSVDLRHALGESEGTEAVLLVCDPQRLVYFAADWYGTHQYVLERR